jgi:rhamnose utilization protein RhaD (predicted bifunctional aldolase and dehydrogenase)
MLVSSAVMTTKSHLLDQIVELSHEFGTSDYVQGGGGNSSVKQDETIWVKPSGTTMAGIQADDFLEVARPRINALYDLVPPENVNEREALVTQLLADSRVDPEALVRPSVETPLHDSFSAAFVMHTHPQMVNGLMCSNNAASTCERLFPEHVCRPPADAGYTVCMQVRQAIADHVVAHGAEPTAVFMENHGIVVAGDTPEAVRATYAHIMDTLAAIYAEKGIPTKPAIGPSPDDARASAIAAVVQSTCDNANTAHWTASGLFAVANDAISPDHVVYMKSYAFFGEPTPDALQAFETKHGYSPRVVVTEDAVICFGSTPRNAGLALDLAKDGTVVAQLAEAFGGVRYMTDDGRRFIENWEAETYRQQVTS